KPVLGLAKRLLMISPEEGGATLTFLATDEAVAGRSGGYYEKNKLKDPAELATDENLGRRLVDVSRTLVGLSGRGTA
ncbi:MAG: short-chain dehydrogenase, partial [Marmoricola sp.]